jgi:hypothetical protein
VALDLEGQLRGIYIKPAGGFTVLRQLDDCAEFVFPRTLGLLTMITYHEACSVSWKLTKINFAEPY